MSGAKVRPSVAADFESDALKKAFSAQLGAAAPSAEGFLIQVIDDCAPDELVGMSEGDLAAILADFWRFASTDGLTDPAIRLRRAAGEGGRDLGYDLLEIVQPDRPFLVDSIMGEIADLGFAVRAMFHPVAELAGVRRSMIQVHLDPVGEDREDVLVAAIHATLADVKAAVEDFAGMRALMRRTVDELRAAPAPESAAEREELIAFLSWLESDHFVFLGARTYEYPRTADGGYAAEEPLYQPEDSLGVLRDQSRAVLRRASEPAILSAQLRKHLEVGDPVVVAKSNLRSRVHRHAYMDYVGVKRYGADGKPSGEIRFVGLFTAEGYEAPAHEVPLIRRKIAGVTQRAGFAPGSHNAKRLRNIVETYPRDELFQMGEDELLAIALGVLHLYDRPRVRLFARRDPFDRFVSILLFVPRDRYDSGVRARAGDILAQAFGGRVSAYYPSFSDAPLARVHYIIGVAPGEHPSPDLSAVEAQIAETARTWEDRFEAAARDGGVARGTVGETLARYASAFSPGYRDENDAAEALADMAVIEDMSADEPVRIRAFRKPADTPLQFRFKLYRPREAAPLANVLPILEHMGLKALIEEGNKVTPIGPDGEARPVWVHEFLLQDDQGEHLLFADARAPFEAAFTAVWTGQTESDGFNRLVLELGISWREAALIRALAKYRQQSGLDPSQAVQEEALSAHPGVARLILDLFRTKFDPALAPDAEARETQAQSIMAQVVEALQAVASLDHDRVLRRLALLVGAVKRTNFYQQDADGAPKPHISFKVASRELDDLPAPKPYREIFVWAPHVEGVHLRFGPVARGGLRWSDRRDDFRTEVLGLVKAQQVKNAVIVPVGAKGGFFVKQPPASGERDAVLAEGIACYKLFIQGLLDITDNIVNGKIVAPDEVVRHDGDDPYLVVAADKGTATFSDIANGIANAHGFWLDDAFASGGSVGYDHKGMGITARGGWESVKRHFRALGRNSQTQDFTCVGVGDMSGDVFGNGMLLSGHIRLLAAFDHRHIFLDPNPDAAISFKERDRMFNLPRSSWEDYDKTLISKGGGVFPRSAKSIPLSPEIKAVLGIAGDASSMSPMELMNAILKAPVDLLWNGGIGTYVKAASETHADVGDRANNGLRVNGTELRCKVVGEGGNLGMTQLGRIEAALNGVLLNTDFIDNSAGVDTSDHEVNIKILLNGEVQKKKLTMPERNKLLAAMTDEVAALVLNDNYRQNQALSLMQRMSLSRLGSKQHFIKTLEAQGLLDRQIEYLPSDAEIADRKARGIGLTRPELSVLLSYSKIVLFQQLLDSDVPEDPYLSKELVRYFPQPLQQKYAKSMEQHRLKREIIATAVTNSMVNRMGSTFTLRMTEDSGRTPGEVAKAFTITRETLDARELWAQIDALDGKVPESVQVDALQTIWSLQRSMTRWLVSRPGAIPAITDAVGRYHDGFREIRAGSGILPASMRPAYDASFEDWKAKGMPESLAKQLAALPYLEWCCDIIEVARARKLKPVDVAKVHFRLGEALQLPWLYAQIDSLAVDGRWHAVARGSLRDELATQQRLLTMQVLATPGANADAKVKHWLERDDAALRFTLGMLAEVAAQKSLDYPTASVAVRRLSMLSAEG